MQASRWIALVALVVAVGSLAGADDEPDSLIAGKLVAVKPGTLIKFRAKGTFPMPTAANDPTVAGASLAVFDTTSGGAGANTFALAAAGWTALGNPSGSAGYKYKGGTADPCRVVLLKPNLLRAVCKGSAITLTPPFSGEVGVILTAGSASKRYCARFAGTDVKNDATLTRRKDAPAPAVCPTTDLGTRVCTLASASSVAGFPSPVFSATGLDGSIDLTCGTIGVDGSAPCTCDGATFAPIVFPSIGEICISAAGPCPSGEIDCDGGDPLAIDLVADHDGGACTGNADCAASCGTLCSGMGATYEVRGSACEGFCQGGSNDDDACTADTQCPGGTCVGFDPPTHGGRCNCQCGGTELGAPSPAGALTCHLGARFTFESGANGLCGNGTVVVDSGPICMPLTTGTSVAVLTDAGGVAGQTIPPGGAETKTGVPGSCASFSAGSVTGLKLVGAFALFDRVSGDSLSDDVFACQ